MPSFYEFFAGGGMARCGLGEAWRCLFANDFDARKASAYRRNWGAEVFVEGDVRKLSASDLPGSADLVWASFPCQDLSLAGGGAGLRGERSGTFWPFWKLISGLKEGGRAPSLVVLENVIGTLTSHGGSDFRAICEALHGGGYRFGAVVVDAATFLPHSRPRLFFIAVAPNVVIPPHLTSDSPSEHWHTRALQSAALRLENDVQDAWLWWNLPTPSAKRPKLGQLIQRSPNDVRWHTAEETDALIGMMAPLHKRKVASAMQAKVSSVGTIYKRTRRDEVGNRVQRAEIRFDDMAGCLRTPAGGSSRQTILIVEKGIARSRLISARETARLMGLPDSYELPDRYNEAYHLTGDGVAVPVVRFLSEALLLHLVPNEEERLAA